MDSAQSQIRARQKRRAAAMAVANWYCRSFLLKTPKHDSVLTGERWISEIIQGNSDRALSVLRMPVSSFLSIVNALVSGGFLKTTKNVSAECAMAMFLFFAGQRGPSNRAIQERFQCSGETVTRHLHAVVDALSQCRPLLSRCQQMLIQFLKRFEAAANSILISTTVEAQ